MPKDNKKDSEPQSPWLKGTGVTGVVPPGRRLSDDRRPNRWSASGVNGVRPPGKRQPGEQMTADWARISKDNKAQKRKEMLKRFEKERSKKSASTESEGFDPLRPMAGFVPDIFADLHDPDDVKAFLKVITDFLNENKPPEAVEMGFSELIRQSHAPFEVLIGFTVLSALVGRSVQKRRKYGPALERGAKVFYNLARRLNPGIKIPKGLVPETMDAIFYDLPDTAYQLPYAFATDAFLRSLELFRDHDEEAEPMSASCSSLRFSFMSALSWAAPLVISPWRRSLAGSPRTGFDRDRAAGGPQRAPRSRS